MTSLLNPYTGLPLPETPPGTGMFTVLEDGPFVMVRFQKQIRVLPADEGKALERRHTLYVLSSILLAMLPLALIPLYRNNVLSGWTAAGLGILGAGLLQLREIRFWQQFRESLQVGRLAGSRPQPSFLTNIKALITRHFETTSDKTLRRLGIYSLIALTSGLVLLCWNLQHLFSGHPTMDQKQQLTGGVFLLTLGTFGIAFARWLLIKRKAPPT